MRGRAQCRSQALTPRTALVFLRGSQMNLHGTTSSNYVRFAAVAVVVVSVVSAVTAAPRGF